MSSKGILGAGIVVLTMIVGVHSCVSSTVAKAKEDKRGMANKTKCRNEDGDWGKIPAGSYRDNAGDCIAGTAPPPPPGFTPIQTEKPWTFRTLDIPESGELALHLSQGWRGFTQGGAVSITTPGGQVFHDRPGVPTDMGFQPEGVYIFHADPIGSKRSMVIYNRW